MGHEAAIVSEHSRWDRDLVARCLRAAAVENRRAEGQFGRLPALAAELVHGQAVVIYAATIPGALVARAATTRIPIVFIGGGDPVQLGLVASFNRPGGNATGVNLFNATLEPKKLELLHPTRTANPAFIRARPQGRELRRPAGLATNQVRTDHQSQDGEGARPDPAGQAAYSRRRGDRVGKCRSEQTRGTTD